MQKVLVIGATGMTGKCLVKSLLDRSYQVSVIVRSPDKLPDDVSNNPGLSVTEANILDLTDEEMARQVADCGAVVSCLGHVMSFQGIFGEPRRLCTDATSRLCAAILSNSRPTPAKFILMSSVGVRNPDLKEKRSLFDRALLAALRHTIPPHRDNETAAGYLHSTFGTGNGRLEWCAVRPDSLINAGVSPYEITESPVTGIVTGRPTTRANVADFMAELIGDMALWETWKFKMPVVMNRLQACTRI